MIQVSRVDREKTLNQKAKVIWFTGLPCSGKTTLASRLERALNNQGFATYLLDADVVRMGLNGDLSFSPEARKENIRRIAEVSKLFVDAGVIVLAAFIAPFQSDRDNAKMVVGKESFLEVFVDCPLEVCEERDVKGMYKKARAGIIKNFTGLDSPYEKPINPDLILKTAEGEVNEMTARLVQWVLPHVSKG